jgi:hypothetical protein
MEDNDGTTYYKLKLSPGDALLEKSFQTHYASCERLNIMNGFVQELIRNNVVRK